MKDRDVVRNIAESCMNDIYKLQEQYDGKKEHWQNHVRELNKIRDDVISEIFCNVARINTYYPFSILWDRAESFAEKYEWPFFVDEIVGIWDIYVDLESDLLHITNLYGGLVEDDKERDN